MLSSGLITVFIYVKVTVFVHMTLDISREDTSHTTSMGVVDRGSLILGEGHLLLLPEYRPSLLGT